jgi:mRNA-degrading endonuclease RelE of RelBE toxin-antitoxin system
MKKTNITPTEYFEKRYKKFSKKFPNLKRDLIDFNDDLLLNPKMGQSLGKGLYKVRLASTDKNKGKSGSFRIITYLVSETEKETDLYLLTIYDKSEESTISKDLLLSIIKKIFG